MFIESREPQNNGSVSVFAPAINSVLKLKGQWLSIVFIAVFGSLGSLLAFADSPEATDAPAPMIASESIQNASAENPEPQEHGLSQKAVEIARPFGFPITNSMVVTWMAQKDVGTGERMPRWLREG